MFRGFYTAASGMIAQQRRTEMLTNNLSNANTTGFKTDQSSVRSFPEMLLSRVDQTAFTTSSGSSLTRSSTSEVGPLSTGVYVQEITPLFKQGAIEKTDLKTDFAIVNGDLPVNAENGSNGTVLFSVENSSGDARYTRDGNFTLDGAGYLTTSSGNYVLDENNNRIQLANENFSVNEDGIILENDQKVARLGVSFAANSYQLVKEGDGLYRAEVAAGITNAYETDGVTFTIQQNSLEGSNVDQSQTMTEMLAAYRSFEANQKILQAYDKSMDKAVNEVGRL